jgi:hypothetical protein
MVTAGRYRGLLYASDVDFVPGSGPVDRYRIVDRQGRRVREFKANPFGEIANQYYSIGIEGPCRLEPDRRAEMEAMEQSW